MCAVGLALTLTLAGIIADNFADEIILEPHEIARRYVRTWFLLDLVSSIPLDYFILLRSTIICEYSRLFCDYFILLFSPDASLSQLLHAGIIIAAVH